MRRDSIVVLKFGSSVLREENDLWPVVHEIYRRLREGKHVVAIVSAFAGETDRLLAHAERYGRCSNPDALARLVATGEESSAALLGLALDRAGLPAHVLDAAQIGLIAHGSTLDGEPHSLHPQKILRVLENGAVAVIPGFVARQEDGSTALLGRGGSDLSALFIAERLGADCCLIKDVDGLYDCDPAVAGTAARRFLALTWDEALSVGGGVVQPKAIAFARQHHLSFEVRALGSTRSTIVGHGESKFDFQSSTESPGPTKVALLGLGTCGLGVYRQLASFPDLFNVVGIAVRDLQRHCDHAPAHLLTTDCWSVIERADVVIELIGGLKPATELISETLAAGKHVITANKLVLATSGPELVRLTAEQNVQLLYSAAAGAAVPVLERLRQIAREAEIEEVTAVLNGTTNLILDRLSEGQSFDEALCQAQAQGFAEADPTEDLNGTDAACKLVLLAHAAFNTDIARELVECEGIQHIDPAETRILCAAGKKIRLVASLRRDNGNVVAQVRPQVIDVDHPLAATRDEQNCVLIRTHRGTSILRGRGAGRWPTTVSIMADLFDLVRCLRHQPEPPAVEALEADQEVRCEV
jgi:homoserine dehydrogenase